MNDCYEALGPRDFEVTGVAWRTVGNVIPVAPMSFETWIISADLPHGVRFTHAETGVQHEGDARDVRALGWQDAEGEYRFTRCAGVPGRSWFRIIEANGEPFAWVIEADDGNPAYLMPPIVLDPDGIPIEGQEVLAAIVATGIGVEVPVIRDATPSDFAEVDQVMAQLSAEMGLPVGPP